MSTNEEKKCAGFSIGELDALTESIYGEAEAGNILPSETMAFGRFVGSAEAESLSYACARFRFNPDVLEAALKRLFELAATNGRRETFETCHLEFRVLVLFHSMLNDRFPSESHAVEWMVFVSECGEDDFSAALEEVALILFNPDYVASQPDRDELFGRFLGAVWEKCAAALVGAGCGNDAERVEEASRRMLLSYAAKATGSRSEERPFRGAHDAMVRFVAEAAVFRARENVFGETTEDSCFEPSL